MVTSAEEQGKEMAMDVNAPGWSQKEFKELSGVCDYRSSWMCSKTGYACKDYMCPLVKMAANIEELRASFINQKS